jgi:hypothetical protein
VQYCQVADGHVPNLPSLDHAAFHLRATQARDVKVWAHRITPEGASEGLPALLHVHHGDETKQFDLQISGGQVLLPLIDTICWVGVRLIKPGET